LSITKTKLPFLRGFFGIESVIINSRKLFEIYYTKTCLKTIEKNLYRNNNYKRLKNLIALNDKHL